MIEIFIYICRICVAKQEKLAQGKTGFVPVKARWVVERSNAWVERYKSLVKNFERTFENANAKLKLCFIRLMIKQQTTCFFLNISNWFYKMLQSFLNPKDPQRFENLAGLYLKYLFTIRY